MSSHSAFAFMLVRVVKRLEMGGKHGEKRATVSGRMCGPLVKFSSSEHDVPDTALALFRVVVAAVHGTVCSYVRHSRVFSRVH